jgi:hypothetical protein
MNRLAALIALVVVASAVSAGISSQSTAALVLATVLMAAGVLVFGFARSAVSANAGVQVSSFREFLACMLQNLFRFGIGAVVIAWTVVGALRFFGA